MLRSGVMMPVLPRGRLGNEGIAEAEGTPPEGEFARRDGAEDAPAVGGKDAPADGEEGDACAESSFNAPGMTAAPQIPAMPFFRNSRRWFFPMFSSFLPTL
jgi:hypothetical protein